MLVWVSLLLAFLSAALGGCAASSEERLAKMEADILYLQAQEIRLAILEDAVSNIISSRKADDNEETPPARPLKPKSGVTAAGASGSAPRRVEPVSSMPPAPKPVPVKSAKRAPVEYQTALARLESGNPESAKTLFKDFIASYPAHVLAPNAGYWLGECYYTLKEYDSAIIAFKDVVAQFPDHDKAPAAMLKAGYSYLQLGDNANARFYLEALLKDYPSSEPAYLARQRLAVF